MNGVQPPISSALRGLYPVTSAAACADPARLLASVEAAIHGGARLVQYRDKENPPEMRLRFARMLVGICHHLGARLIINDDPELAASAGADGVHLGAADPPLAEARARLGRDALIGVSCGPDLTRAQAALDAGADYLAFGRFHPSRTKPDAPAADLDLLRQARARFALPLCAIGGIRPDNAAALVQAGADLIAAVDGVFSQPDAAAVEVAARAYARAFDEAP
jgi:thiamine-phosphate diphosphorylase